MFTIIILFKTCFKIQVSEGANGCDAFANGQESACHCPSAGETMNPVIPLVAPLTPAPGICPGDSISMPASCKYNHDCFPWGKLCRGGTCSVPVKQLGLLCAEDSECETGDCFGSSVGTQSLASFSASDDRVCQCHTCEGSGCGGCPVGQGCYEPEVSIPNM